MHRRLPALGAGIHGSMQARPCRRSEAALAAHGQFSFPLAFEPPAFRRRTRASSGHRRRPFRTAPCVRGARAISCWETIRLPDGELLRSAGRYENVAGSTSAAAVRPRSHLGFITEISLKVAPPAPSPDQTLCGSSWPAAAAVDPSIAGRRWRADSGGAVAGKRLAAALRQSRGAHRASASAGRHRPATAHAWWEALRHCQLPCSISRVVWRCRFRAGQPPRPLMCPVSS